jgi:UDP:flavonoid glycosyltransferase YjiC (YdhE family)
MHDTIVTAPGSLGDVNPLLGIAQQLQAQGRNVLFLAAEPYLPLAERAGLQTKPLTTQHEFHELCHDPNLWHPRRGPKLLFDKALRLSLVRHYDWLEQNCVPGKTLMVSHFLDFSSRVFRDRHPSTRLVSVVLAPATFRSVTHPPQLSGTGLETKLPRWMLRAAFWCADRWVDSMALPHINALRKNKGLAAVSRIMQKWWMSPDAVLAMFPQWYENIHEGVQLHEEKPSQVRYVDFPMTDSATLVTEEVRADFQRVLQIVGDSKPILFAPGSAHHQAKKFLQAAADACRRMNRSGILLSPNTSEQPSSLPANVATAQYLPFSQLLPHVGAVVHHGGIGTTSQCLAAGVPQIVLPMAFDQFDNADRVMRLGCGSWFPMRRVSAEKLVEHLSRLALSAEKSNDVAKRLSTAGREKKNPCEVAAELAVGDSI